MKIFSRMLNLLNVKKALHSAIRERLTTGTELWIIPLKAKFEKVQLNAFSYIPTKFQLESVKLSDTDFETNLERLD